MARLLKTEGSCTHGSRTCSMGLVVDCEYCVNGTEGLRVVDTNIFLLSLAAHYKDAVYALAEQASLILERRPG